MLKGPQVPLIDLVMCLADAVDLVSPQVSSHHKQVAYIAHAIASERQEPPHEQADILMAGLLHDIGALSLKDRLDLLRFETDNSEEHAEAGWLLLDGFEPLSRVAPLVRFHHAPWEHYLTHRRVGIPLGSHILHLADRISISMSADKNILGQVDRICSLVSQYSGSKFAPELVETFLTLASKEHFWLDVVSSSVTALLVQKAQMITLRLDLDAVYDLAELISKVIDFRSRFTATHSSGVAACAEAIARTVGLSETECRMMRIAGYLHDVGKLAVPVEILEKAGPLDQEDWAIVRAHTYHTYRVLQNVEQLDQLSTWAAFHHERLDGAGYPFHVSDQDLLLAHRIMAVSDIFSAITEDRPYRAGMSRTESVALLDRMAQQGALDPNLVQRVIADFERINSARIEAQALATHKYQEFGQNLAFSSVSK